jgi:hypothetical protein
VSKTILIAPFDGPLAAALASEAAKAGWSVAMALARSGAVPGGSAPVAEDAPPAAPAPAGPASATLYYDPRSFVSASALAISAENAIGPLDALALVFDPAAARAGFLEAKPGELASLVEERCAGPLFLAREVVRRFEARRSGRIVLIAPERPRDAALGPAAAMADGAFEGLGAGLFAAAEGAAWCAFGVRDASGQSERAARYALDLLAGPKPSKAGRWARYSGKGGLFG